ncbi:MAG: exopolysaccharide Pel transporter PelG [Acutalibacteraceae bacterium]|nr:exopolysaccharide Pel transporter PelG [Acutalibacteraceae bacterium]
MAGIGFELKRLFHKKGVLNTTKAYGYATVICAGPMLLGVILLLGIMALCTIFNMATADRELLICMITYTLLASVTVTSFFSMVVTRYVADMLFEEENHAVLPCFWGSTVIMMAVGSILYGIFLLFSGATLVQGLLCFVLFGELIIVWNAMSFLSAIKDYKGIFLSFLTSVAVSILLGALLLWLKFPVVEALLFAVSVGYGIMLVWDVILLHRYFPHTSLGAFTFLKWIDAFLPLALSGLFMNIGMFSHLVIMWFSDIKVHVHGLFYGAPWHDVPALLAFMTALMTTVNFVVSVEVNFYPKYRNHYSLYNDKGTIKDILQSEKEMLDTLKTEIFYTALKQLLFTATCIALGGYLLDLLPLGFNEIMRGYFRTLCVAYGLYAIGNMLMLILLYFTDYKGACVTTAIFAISTILLTLVSLLFSNVYYGFGFLIAAMIFVIATALRLDYFTRKLPYYILSVQPLVAEDRSGLFARLGVFLEDKFERG